MAIVKDKAGKKYLIKQKRQWGEKRNVKHAVLETLNSYIANILEIPSQKVWIVPTSLDIPGKNDIGCAGSLHSFIKGEKLDECYSMRSIFNLYKSRSAPHNVLRQIIFKLSRRLGMAPIFALDTFIGNPDRIKKNVIYDKKEDICYAIDMGSAFGRNYAELINEIMKSWVPDEMVFDEQEHTALTIYRDTLKKAVELFPAEYLHLLSNKLCQEVKTSIKETEILKKTNKMMKQHYQSCVELVKTLDMILTHCKKRKLYHVKK